mmetsp:Transcript_87744/g.256497  ORF Transcript_87744/g.256497 Transcript_87744/m.256497 type:complete len:1251 (-) Transcript_87744:103-3855(-)
MAAELDGSFEGKIVEINGNGRPMQVAQEEDGGGLTQLADMDMDGQKGYCLGFSEETQEYTVQTFGGLMASVPEDCLNIWIAEAAPEDGGCDLLWPDEAEPHAIFGSVVADTLKRKGYCMIQMSIDNDVLSTSVSTIQGMEDYDRMREEAVVDYLGRDNVTKLKQMEDDVPDEEPNGALGMCDRYVSNLGFLLAPESTDSFGYELIGRTNGFARVPCTSKAEASALTPPYSDDEVAAGRVEGFFQWVQSRKIAVILMLEGEAGDIILHPKPGCGQDIPLPMRSNKMLIFRHDSLSYTYHPQGTSTALQAWLLSGLPSIELRSIEGEQKDYAESLRLTGPWQPEGEQALVKSLMVRMPGRSWGYYNYWNMFVGGTDCVMEWSGTRWDTDLYYEEDRDRAMMTGKSYMHHGGFLDEVEFNCFDNVFFGLTEDETMCLYPGQRIVLETGYESLNRAGYSRSQAAGELIGVQIGDVGPDWHSADSWWPYVVEGDFTQKRCGINASITATRLSHFLNLIGPTNSVATACSSSLVALNIAHHNMANQRDEKGRIASGKPVFERAVVIGINTLMGPMSFMGQCSMGGTTYKGRSFTFDMGADGYQRGEGCSATFVQMNSHEVKNTDRLGCVIGSAVNQDGRSASLTAPNGPSQQLCMRSSMRDGNVSPTDTATNENHGTGTALGDPIEVGSVRSIFRGRGDCPIPVTSSKSNLGHQEATAGSNGLLRTLVTLLNAAVPATVHLAILNQHIELEGFPGAFPQESLDLNRDNNIAGLNSFGFGGTNSRAELWGHALHGPRGDQTWFRPFDKRRARPLGFEHLRKLDCVSVACPRCAGPMCWLCGAALPLVPRPGKHHCSAIREEQASYEHCSECYEGAYKFGGSALGVFDQGEKVYLTGTWSAWASPLEMKPTDDGAYTAEVALGDTCLEEFHILLDRNRERALFPVAPRASCRARVAGPAKLEAGRNWLIDGRKDGAQTGSVYRIRLEWTDTQRRISWEKLERTAEEESEGAAHSYGIISSLTSFRPVEMQRSEADPLRWEFTGKMTSKEEMFLFQRDRDPKQLIYPLENRPRDASVPVLGPDAGTGMGKDMRLWSVRGQPGDIVMVRLHIKDGDIRVTAISENKGQMTWHNAHGGARDRYFVKCDWSERLEEMEPDMADLDVCRLQFSLPPALGYVSSGHFQIVVNRDERKVLHPGHPNAAPGRALPEGPDADGEGLCWEVNGPPGQTFELSLDLGAEDDRKTVTCRPLRQLKGLPAA